MKFFTTILQFSKFDVSPHCDAIKEQLIDSKRNLINREKDALSKYKESIKNNPEYEYDFDIEISNEIYSIENTFPEIIHNSAFIYSYSYFEISLRNIKLLIEKYIVVKHGNPNINTIKGSYIKKFRTFIEQITGIAFVANTTIWDNISLKGKIRNCIVHNASNLVTDATKPIDQQELFGYISGNTNFQLNPRTGDFFIKEVDFVLDFVDEIEFYIRYIYNELEKLPMNNYN